MFDLVLYYYPTCPYCRKVTRLIDKHNLEEIELKNINQDEQAESELIEIGGKRQVPCLFIDGDPLYESNDIISWRNTHIIDS
jgi:glutaredoxin